MSAIATVPRGPETRPATPGLAQLDELFRRYQCDGDLAARDELVTQLLPLAHRLARRYAHSSEPYEDLAQVASLALVRAIDRFDHERGNDFAAFAIPTILGDLKRYFRDCTWAVHVSRGVQERALAIVEGREQLTNVRGRPPSVQEIAEHLELTSEEVLEGLQAAEAYVTLSLDAPRGSAEDSDELTVGDALGDEDARYELIEADIVVANAVQELPVRDRHILHLRFVAEMTQSEIAAQMGISQMQISRLLRRSIAQLRTLAGAEC
jgi:RNA polymerase sigma-B factor